MVKVIAILAILAISGCTTTSGSFCSIAKPIRLSEQAIAAMSDEEVRDALAHNRKLQSLCGVRP
jgi:hypothetical protein